MKSAQLHELEPKLTAIADRLKAVIDQAVDEVRDLREQADALPHGHTESMFVDSLDWSVADALTIQDIARGFGKDI